MKNDIRSRTIKFLAAQTAILAGIMLAFVVLASVLFVRNSERWQLRNIEDDVLMFAQQAARAEEIPKRGDLGAYMFFILDLEGNYILPRMPRSDEGETLWQEYERKLVYEMQKRRDGWSYYPERDRLRWNEGQYVVRYVFLEKQGWIVAAEGFLPSAAAILGGFLTPGLLAGLVLIVAAAFALMLVNAFWHFRRVMRAILRSQENNFISHAELPSVAVSAEPLRAAGTGLVSESVPRSAAAAETFHVPVRELPDALRRPLPFPAVSVRSSAASVLPVPLSEGGYGQSANTAGKPPAASQPRPAPRPAPEAVFAPPPPPATPRQFDEPAAVTIDTEGIRSGVLRDIINEMRGRGR